MEKKVGCIGSGVMGGALMAAVCKIENAEVHVSDVDFAKAEKFAEENGAKAEKTNRDILNNCNFVFLAVKPAYLPSVLGEIKAVLSEEELNRKVFISMAAGVKIETIAEKLGKSAKIIRIMPNIPALVSEAMIALSPNENVAGDEITAVQDLLSKAGSVQVVPEHLMDGITAVSGSGPAYGFLFVEALADAAVSFGMTRKQALIFAAQTLKGAATMVLETGKHPAVLKDEVCSPAGTTIEGVRALEDKGFRSAVIAAATAAYQKSCELGKN